MTTVVLPRAAAAAPRSVARAAFPAVIAFYWMMQYALASGASVTRGGVLYALFVGPITLFVVVALAEGAFRIRFAGATGWTAAFVASVVAIALARGDLRTVLNVGLLGATILAVFAFRLSLSTRLVGSLFWASVAAGTLAWLGGHSVYAPVPGWTDQPGLEWRISLFPFIAPSAFFSLTVLLVYLVRSDGPWRRSTIAAATYFLVFSALRSAWLAALLALAYLALVERGLLRTAASRVGFAVAAVAAFVAFLLADSLLVGLSALGGDWINTYVLRSGGGFGSAEDAAVAIYRTYIWSEHLRIAATNPLFGIGTFDFLERSAFDAAFGDLSSGSEAFLTGLLARVGLPALLLVAAVLSAARDGARRDAHLAVVSAIVVVVAMLAYGSFINAYDVVFLCLLSALAAPQPGAAEQPA